MTNKKLLNKAKLIVKLHHLDNDSDFEKFFSKDIATTSCHVCKFWTGGEGCGLTATQRKRRGYGWQGRTTYKHRWCIGWLAPKNKTDAK